MQYDSMSTRHLESHIGRLIAERAEAHADYVAAVGIWESIFEEYKACDYGDKATPEHATKLRKGLQRAWRTVEGCKNHLEAIDGRKFAAIRL